MMVIRNYGLCNEKITGLRKNNLPGLFFDLNSFLNFSCTLPNEYSNFFNLSILGQLEKSGLIL